MHIARRVLQCMAFEITWQLMRAALLYVKRIP
jgi:hypothetical protein